MNRANRTVLLDQTNYVKAMWKRFESKSVKSPFIENWKIHGYDGRNIWSRSRFRLRFLLSRISREPIIHTGVHSRRHFISCALLIRFLNDPPKSVCLAAMRVPQYLYNTKEIKLTICGMNSVSAIVAPPLSKQITQRHKPLLLIQYTIRASNNGIRNSLAFESYLNGT